jgi:hypothetical protein
MSNGLGAGLFAITLLTVLAGLALLVVMATVAAAVFDRRSGRVPMGLRYLHVAICAGVFGVAVFAVLALYDEAPVAAGLFTAIVVVPCLLVSGYLARSTDLARLDVVAATVMAWAIAFFVGVGVSLGITTGMETVLDLAPAESRQLGVAWVAAASGGLVVVLAMIPLGTRLGRLLVPASRARERL